MSQKKQIMRKKRRRIKRNIWGEIECCATNLLIQSKLLQSSAGTLMPDCNDERSAVIGNIPVIDPQIKPSGDRNGNISPRTDNKEIGVRFTTNLANQRALPGVWHWQRPKNRAQDAGGDAAGPTGPIGCNVDGSGGFQMDPFSLDD